jgi:hypothetical protein
MIDLTNDRNHCIITTMIKATILVTAAVLLTGCVAVVPKECRKDHRDRPWDPAPCGPGLLEQLPNWDPTATIDDAQRGPAARDIVIRR